jgi:hypothetical protein
MSLSAVSEGKKNLHVFFSGSGEQNKKFKKTAEINREAISSFCCVFPIKLINHSHVFRIKGI